MKSINYFTKLGIALVAVAMAGFTVSPGAYAAKTAKNLSQLESLLKGAKNLAQYDAYLVAFLKANPSMAAQVVTVGLTTQNSKVSSGSSPFQQNVITTVLGNTTGTYVAQVVLNAATSAPSQATFTATTAVSSGNGNQAAAIAAAATAGAALGGSPVSPTALANAVIAAAPPGSQSAALITAAAVAAASNPSATATAINTTAGTGTSVSATS